eukprot:TRINITY_DN28412_c0_g1_i1.p1 TRINITY_DN28412_c0_g1~~TRINITY_DN28412_c0_g1_i1.p1  ORF type:complete len:400 (+),score=64.29 TRINITY_DN28412_c0_g1_i1:72-1271(+)
MRKQQSQWRAAVQQQWQLGRRLERDLLLLHRHAPAALEAKPQELESLRVRARMLCSPEPKERLAASEPSQSECLGQEARAETRKARRGRRGGKRGRRNKASEASIAKQEAAAASVFFPFTAEALLGRLWQEQECRCTSPESSFLVLPTPIASVMSPLPHEAVEQPRTAVAVDDLLALMSDTSDTSSEASDSESHQDAAATTCAGVVGQDLLALMSDASSEAVSSASEADEACAAASSKKGEQPLGVSVTHQSDGPGDGSLSHLCRSVKPAKSSPALCEIEGKWTDSMGNRVHVSLSRGPVAVITGASRRKRVRLSMDHWGRLWCGTYVLHEIGYDCEPTAPSSHLPQCLSWRTTSWRFSIWTRLEPSGLTPRREQTEGPHRASRGRRHSYPHQPWHGGA